jgi:hypothetical protein
MSQAREPYTVRIVVDSTFGERPATLPAGDPVWIIESEQNTPVAHRLWKASTPDDDLTITTFKPGSAPCTG